MELKRVRIQNFRSIEDTEPFEIDDITCLVGKNEAGKTAILEALYGLRPYRNFQYSKIRDYPRRFLTKFDERHSNGSAETCRTWWDLSETDIKAVNSVLGESVVSKQEIEVWKEIGSEGTSWKVDLDESLCVSKSAQALSLNAVEQTRIAGIETTAGIVTKISEIETPSEKLLKLKEKFEGFRENRATLKAIDILSSRMPKFFYTSHYDRMSGEISLMHLRECEENDEIAPGDQIFLDFIEYAGTSLEALEDSSQHEELVATCEAASNDITDEMLEFWSQNDALSVKIEIGEGKSDDPPPFNKGAIVKIRIWNDHHRASVPLSERSAGFVWFFSFLSQFKQLSKSAGNAIILLDEPGLTLHGKAQSDLLRFIRERLLPDHQVIFTTHSPFMVPANELNKVRVVEDVVEYPENRRTRPIIKGTKVSDQVLSVDRDTLFPLQSHLGYELTQSLFIGQNTLLVEGPSDILFIQAVSHELKRRDRESLSPKWTICPTGGIDKIQAFVSLFAGNNLNVAVLTDYAKGDKGKIERLKQSQILESSKIFTTSDFTGKNESDIEDLFELAFYAELLNVSFELPPKVKLNETKLLKADEKTERAVKKAEAAFRIMPPEVKEFDHFTPSAYLLSNLDLLEPDEKEVNDSLNHFENAFMKLNKLL